jgi:hypothetical protein
MNFNFLKGIFKKHVHNFSETVIIQGTKFVKCSGCNLHDLHPDQIEADRLQQLRMDKMLADLRDKRTRLLV